MVVLANRDERGGAIRALPASVSVLTLDRDRASQRTSWRSRERLGRRLCALRSRPTEAVLVRRVDTPLSRLSVDGDDKVGGWDGVYDDVQRARHLGCARVGYGFGGGSANQFCTGG